MGFETAGAQLDVRGGRGTVDTRGWAIEVMNVPGVLAGDADLQVKNRRRGRREGYPWMGTRRACPGRGVAAYAASGITTDHECTRSGRGQGPNRALGMRILLREGSAA